MRISTASALSFCHGNVRIHCLYQPSLSSAGAAEKCARSLPRWSRKLQRWFPIAA